MASRASAQVMTLPLTPLQLCIKRWTVDTFPPEKFRKNWSSSGMGGHDFVAFSTCTISLIQSLVQCGVPHLQPGHSSSQRLQFWESPSQRILLLAKDQDATTLKKEKQSSLIWYVWVYQLIKKRSQHLSEKCSFISFSPAIACPLARPLPLASISPFLYTAHSPPDEDHSAHRKSHRSEFEVTSVIIFCPRKIAIDFYLKR